MDQETVRQNIQKLIDKYNFLKDGGRIKEYNEAQTRNEFIEPLFEFLGWDMRNLNSENEVSTEEKISKGRVDLAFRLNGIPKFFLEAKSMKSDLDVEQYSRQAINYSWNKGVSWAVLTDFESIKIFNAQAESSLLRDKLVFEISCNEYISDFDRLRLLSKESFEKNKLDAYAEKYGKKSKKVTVNEKLFADLRKAREILNNGFRTFNKNIDPEILDEGVQRVLDRLVFIRVLEDRELEPPILKSLLHEREKDGQKQAFAMLKEKFKEFDNIYNSNIFSKHTSDDWEEYGEMEKVIKLLYGNDIYEYNFKEIPSDILGGVYESYLGYISQNPINVKEKKGKLFELDNKKQIKMDSRKKRKEHGIYYTPKFIVDYIVKNTLGEKLKEIESVNELKRIKILDPACGSGSFLTKALEIMKEKYQNFGYSGDQNTKSQILLENIHGVDLDSQAVELAKLNLLLDALDKKEKLPNLTQNIRNGNSLISGKDEDLKNYFGKNFKDKKPFNWEEEFPQVFEQGGFDVIIGNPPYVIIDSNNNDLKYFQNEFQSSKGGKINLYKLFIEKSIFLLKDGGLLGFICPSNYISSKDSYELRKFLLNNTNLIEIIEYSEKDKIFHNVTQALTTIVLRRKKYNNETELHLITRKHGENRGKQAEFLNNKNLEFIFPNKIIDKISNFPLKISDVAECYQGEINVSTKKHLFVSEKISNSLPLLRGNLIKNYNIFNNSTYCPLDADSRHHWDKDRVVFQEVSNQQQVRRLKAAIVKSMLCGHTTNYCFPRKSFNIYCILALINSKLLNYYFSFFNKTNHVPVGEVKNIPIPEIDIQTQEIIGVKAKKLLDLNIELKSIPENSDKWNEIKREIEKTDHEIDQKVYELYGLTEEEINVIEEKKE